MNQECGTEIMEEECQVFKKQRQEKRDDRVGKST